MLKRWNRETFRQRKADMSNRPRRRKNLSLTTAAATKCKEQQHNRSSSRGKTHTHTENSQRQLQLRFSFGKLATSVGKCASQRDQARPSGLPLFIALSPSFRFVQNRECEARNLRGFHPPNFKPGSSRTCERANVFIISLQGTRAKSGQSEPWLNCFFTADFFQILLFLHPLFLTCDNQGFFCL